MNYEAIFYKSIVDKKSTDFKKILIKKDSFNLEFIQNEILLKEFLNNTKNRKHKQSKIFKLSIYDYNSSKLISNDSDLENCRFLLIKREVVISENDFKNVSHQKKLTAALRIIQPLKLIPEESVPKEFICRICNALMNAAVICCNCGKFFACNWCILMKLNDQLLNSKPLYCFIEDCEKEILLSSLNSDLILREKIKSFRNRINFLH